ncbi:hypothetical protein EDI_147020 [Entamoeba dispar SAW760]|uniref:Uncharacterized protein n=1 Tax=Entamoeba dispar (strain ATCC PRA-260 / SAW760) TaxID=370354 RepID=B0ESS2_ENTDS|nr:uncharacterized protein EDI_147020 [Entamoeba dispar SAW760]EDR22418.1 hypothetical protein EDI_147020 [Entamoeba dispar SAW760]|eukprot:EDR22418.1 hypothetical protein EDI_147020 [Entamoeba dispar SAW760]
MQKKEKDVPSPLQNSSSEEVRKKLLNVENKTYFSFVMPSGVALIVAVALIITSVILPFIGKAPVKTIEMTRKQLGQSLPNFDLDEMDIEDIYYYSALADSVNVTMKLVDLELDDLDISELSLDKLYFLTMLSDRYELDINEFKGETKKFFKDYGFIDDLEMEEERLEADDQHGETIIKRLKPESVEACFYAIEIMKKTGEFKSFKKSKKYQKMIEYIIKMQGESGLIYNNKNVETSLKVMVFALKLLTEARNNGIINREIDEVINKVKNVYEYAMNIDGSYDYFLEDTPSCFGTAYGVVGRKLVGLKIKPTTKQYLMSCVTEKGPVIFRGEPEIDIETGYIINEALNGVKDSPSQHNEKASTLSCIFIAVAIVVFISESLDQNTLKEIIVSLTLSLIGSIIGYLLQNTTLQIFFIIPLGYCIFLSIKRIESWKRHAMFWMIVLTPASIIGCVLFIIDSFFPTLIVDMTASYIVFAILVGLLVTNQLVFYSLFNDKHKYQWFFDASHLAYYLAYFTLIMLLGASDNFEFVLSTLQLSGSMTYHFIGVPIIFQSLSLVAIALSVPAVSLMAQIKNN